MPDSKHDRSELSVDRFGQVLCLWDGTGELITLEEALGRVFEKSYEDVDLSALEEKPDA
jgi:hypothetical protein